MFDPTCFCRVKEAEAQLSKLVQDPIVEVQNALRPLMKALVSAHLLRNPDSDVRLYVVSCLTEIMRITAPEAPYNDHQMKEIFQVTVKAFGKLGGDATCHSYEKAVTVLDTVSRVRLSLVMLDLECDELILKMFRQFLKIIRLNHPESVLLSMEAIMVTVIHESEEVPMDLLEILLSAVKKESQDVSRMASWLVERVIISCACKLQPCIMEALKSTETSVDMYSPVVLAICQGEAEAYIVVKPKRVEALSPSSKARNGSRKRNRSKIEGCLPTPASKKRIVKKDDPEEEDFMESDLEKPEDIIKTVKSSKKERAQNGSAKALSKKPLAESEKERAHAGLTKTSAKKPLAEFKKERAHNGLAKTSAKKPLEESKRKRTAGEEVESHKSELGEKLVGKKMKIWWPLDKKFYEGVIKSYCSRKKRHQVSYFDGDVENLDLKKERWEIIQDNSSFSDQEKEIDLPDSTPLSDILRMQEAKKRNNVRKNVELSTSSDVRSSKKKNDPVTNSTKLKGVSNKQESRQELNAETGRRTKGRAEKRQKVTPPIMHHESEKDKEEPETKGEEDGPKCGGESNAEPERKRDHQELPGDSNDETKAGGEEQEVAKEVIAETETDGAEHKVAKETAAGPKADGAERESMKEPNEEPNTEVHERESAKETPADTKLIEKEDMSEESHGDAYTSVAETGKVENEDGQRVLKELEEETDKAEVGTIRVSV
ncbi:hypothetical protein N665_1166s0009 [Sinapis alba]|nr:hypothetical protein N665_1166s0009 [Sinapis alba]